MEASLWGGRWQAYVAENRNDPRSFETVISRFGNLVTEPEIITTWDQFRAWSETFSHGYFRGQHNALWFLQPIIERDNGGVYRQFDVDEYTRMAGGINRLENERALLSGFLNAAPQYHPFLLESHQTVDCLALMQHYGVPTRMLDWTLSPFIALYFAMESDAAHCRASALWGMDRTWFLGRSEELLTKHYPDCGSAGSAARHDFINRNILTLEDSTSPVIVEATPSRLNERIEVQRGVLLANINPINFSRALIMMMIHPAEVTRQVVSKVEIDRSVRTEFLERLREEMGICKESLFPGSDELGRLLAQRLRADITEQVEVKIAEILQDRIARGGGHNDRLPQYG